MIRLIWVCVARSPTRQAWKLVKGFQIVDFKLRQELVWTIGYRTRFYLFAALLHVVWQCRLVLLLASPRLVYLSDHGLQGRYEGENTTSALCFVLNGIMLRGLIMHLVSLQCEELRRNGKIPLYAFVSLCVFFFLVGACHWLSDQDFFLIKM